QLLPVCFRRAAFPAVLRPALGHAARPAAAPHRGYSAGWLLRRFRRSSQLVARFLPEVSADLLDQLSPPTPTLCETGPARVQDQPTITHPRCAPGCARVTSDR